MLLDGLTIESPLNKTEELFFDTDRLNKPG